MFVPGIIKIAALTYARLLTQTDGSLLMIHVHVISGQQP